MKRLFRSRAGAITLLLYFGVATVGADLPRPGWLGFGFVRHMSEDGSCWLMVERVADEGPARRGGLYPQDAIVEIDGKPLRFANDFEVLQFLGKVKAGQKIRFTLRRAARTVKVTVLAVAMSDEQFVKWRFNLEHARESDRR
jgi:C-terminal processing protease CtpA/Prc